MECIWAALGGMVEEKKEEDGFPFCWRIMVHCCLLVLLPIWRGDMYFPPPKPKEFIQRCQCIASHQIGERGWKNKLKCH
eukprot:scaffold187124_cov38-Attheya_sp.AAC.1